MSSNVNADKGKAQQQHEGAPGVPGKAAHGGDVAPPNSDDAGERQSPESGPPSPPTGGHGNR